VFSVCEKMAESDDNFRMEIRKRTLETLENGLGTDFSFLVGPEDDGAEV
jgi:hypothetical protein